MKTIYKFQLNLHNYTNELMLPIDSKVLTVQLQNNIISLWIEINLDEKQTELRRFKIIATGQSFEDTDAIYIATVQQGILVWHIFEEK